MWLSSTGAESGSGPHEQVTEGLFLSPPLSFRPEKEKHMGKEIRAKRLQNLLAILITSSKGNQTFLHHLHRRITENSVEMM